MGERRVRNAEVVGSIPMRSTIIIIYISIKSLLVLDFYSSFSNTN